MAWTNLSFAYGSILTSTKMTQLYDNIVTVAPNFASGKYGTLYNYQEILATNSSWAPTSGAHSLIVCCIGGGGGGAGTTSAAGFAGGGESGEVKYAEVNSVSGTYVVIIGSGGVSHIGSAGANGGTTSFSSVCSANGGLGGPVNNVTSAAIFLNGASNYLRGGAGNPSNVGSSAPANSGAGGGGGYNAAGAGGGSGGTGRVLVWEFS